MAKRSFQYTLRMFPRFLTNIRTGKRTGISYDRYESKTQMGGYLRKIKIIKRR